MDPMEKRVIIHSYSKAWKIENRIYAIQNLVLPVPHLPSGPFVFCHIFLGLSGFCANLLLLYRRFPFCPALCYLTCTSYQLLLESKAGRS